MSICDKKGNTPLHKCTRAFADFVNTAAAKKKKYDIIPSSGRLSVCTCMCYRAVNPRVQLQS